MAKDKVNTTYLSSLVEDYRAKVTDASGVSDIITFTEASWGLGFTLFPMQRFILKMFYGLPLESETKSIPLKDELNSKTLAWYSEKEMLDYLIQNKRVNLPSYTPGQKWTELILCCGRRASKTNIISIICAYEGHRMIKLGNPQAYYGFPSGQEIAITTVASVSDQASTLFSMIKNRIVDCPFFKGRIDSDTQIYFSIQTDEDIRLGRAASVRVYCAGAGDSSIRGKNNLIVVMDEAAFFSKVGKSSLDSAWAALTPSVASFVPKDKTQGEGKIIMLSSPSSKSGMFWEKYLESYDYPDTMLMFQMYTAMINIRVDSALLRQALRRDKNSFRCEYGGEFSDTIAGWIDVEVLKSCIQDEKRTHNLPKGEPDIAYYMGIDYGGKNDGTSLAICHREESGCIVLDYADVYYGSTSDVWESSVSYYGEVNRLFAQEEAIPLVKFADEVQRLCEKFQIVEGWFDQFNGYGLLELLKERGLNQFETKVVSNQLNLQVYQTAKELINTGLMKLFNHPVLIPELASLEENRNGALIRVEAPQRTGFHDDISDAFARAVYSAYNSKKGKVRHSTLSLAGTHSAASGRNWQMQQMRRYLQHGGMPDRYGGF